MGWDGMAMHTTRRAAVMAVLGRIPSFLLLLLERMLTWRGLLAFLVLTVALGWSHIGQLIEEGAQTVRSFIRVGWPIILAVMIILIPDARVRRVRMTLKRFSSQLLVGTLVFVGALLVLGCVLYFPSYLASRGTALSSQALDRSETLKAENDIRATLLQGVGGFLLVVGAIGTWRQIRIAREGQITERFTRAVDQLGSGTLDVKLGGIYALERIALNSPPDRGAIAEILTAYVRDHSPWPSNTTPGPAQRWPERLRIRSLFSRSADPHDAETEIEPLQRRAPDVQAILTVLGRIPINRERFQSSIVLRAVDIRGAELDSADFSSTDFNGANLEGVNISWCSLKDSDLSHANLLRAKLYNTHFGGATIFSANLREAELGGAKFGEGTTFGGAIKVTSIASLSSSDLRSANLRGADLRNTTLNDVDLRGADLQGARLGGANLSGADLRDAKLKNIDFEDADLNGAEADSATLWPSGFDFVSAGVKMIE